MSKKIFFENSKGNKICGILTTPKLKTKKIAILLHGFSSSKDCPTNLALEKILIADNIAVFRLDSYGRGDSEGKFEDITLSKTIDETKKAIELVKNQGYSKIALVGYSFGGMTAIAIASQIPLAAVAFKSPVSEKLGEILANKSGYTLEEWKEMGYINYRSGSNLRFKVNYSLHLDTKNSELYKKAKKITAPTLIVHGDKDSIVPLEQSLKLNKAIPNSELKIVKGADHNYSEPKNFKKMVSLISQHLSKHL